MILNKTTGNFPLTLKEYEEIEARHYKSCKEFITNNITFEVNCLNPNCWPRFATCRLCFPGFGGDNCDQFIIPSNSLTAKILFKIPISVNDIEGYFNDSSHKFLDYFSINGLRTIFGGPISWEYFISRSINILDFRYSFKCEFY